MVKLLAPIVLFVYRRLEHTQRTIEALVTNEMARESDLIIFSDAARAGAAENEVGAVRQYLGRISGFQTITVIKREKNLGLANSIIGGVTQVLKEHDCVIVMEDDLVTSPYFLRYMNEALEYYADDDRVTSIHGYVYPIKQQLPETFFLTGADCWGWATWRRGWENFNPNGEHLLSELRRRKLTKQFDFNGMYGYTRMLEGQISGVNDSWAVRWYASAFLQNKLTLYPGRSLVHNIGNDSSGTHCGACESFDVSLSSTPIRVGGIAVEDSREAREAFVAYGLSLRSWRNPRALLARLFHSLIRNR